MIIFCLLFWIILSGQFSPFFVGSAILSIGLTIFIDRKLFAVSSLFFVPQRAWFIFIIKLFKDMLISSFKMMKIIWLNSAEVTPCHMLINAQSKNKNDQVIQANSITLTPGTMTLHLENNQILVHAINSKMLEEVDKC